MSSKPVIIVRDRRTSQCVNCFQMTDPSKQTCGSCGKNRLVKQNGRLGTVYEKQEYINDPRRATIH